MKPFLSVVLPVFNEEKNIPLLVQRYQSLANDVSVEVIFVEDGGSTDNTRKEIERAAQQHSFIKPLFIPTRGYGISIFRGLQSARGEFLAWTHADLQTDPVDVLRAYKIIKEQPHPERTYVKGDRNGRALFDQVFTTGMSVFETLYFGTILYDINAQPNVFHRSFLEGLPEPPHDFSFDLFMLYYAKRRNFVLIRIPVDFKRRIHGNSSWNTGLRAKWRFIKRTLLFTTKLKKQLRESTLGFPFLIPRHLNLVRELAEIRFSKFCFIGGISTIINYGFFLLTLVILDVNYLLSSGIGYLAGVLFSFFFNKTITFQAHGKIHSELANYVGVYVGSLLLSLALLYVLVNIIEMNPFVANVIVIFITTITNFMGCTFFVFRPALPTGGKFE